MDYKQLLTRKHMPFVVGGLIVIIIAYLYYKHRSTASRNNTGSTLVSLPTSANGSPLMESPMSFGNLVPSGLPQMTASIPGIDSGSNSLLNGVTQTLGTSTQPVLPSVTPPTPPPLTQVTGYANGVDGNGMSTVYNPIGGSSTILPLPVAVQSAQQTIAQFTNSVQPNQSYQMTTAYGQQVVAAENTQAQYEITNNSLFSFPGGATNIPPDQWGNTQYAPYQAGFFAAHPGWTEAQWVPLRNP